MIRKRKIRNTKKIYKHNNFFNRLFFYKNVLEKMQELGKLYIKSDELSAMLNVTSALIRQDFVILGNIGVSGRGSSIKQLLEHIDNLILRDVSLNYIFVGNNELSTTILLKLLEADISTPIHCFVNEKVDISYFQEMKIKKGNDLFAGFHERISNLTIFDYNDLYNVQKPKIFDVAVISSDYNETPKIYDLLKAIEIKSILNYSKYFLSSTKKIYIENVDFTDNMSYFIDIMEYRH